MTGHSAAIVLLDCSALDDTALAPFEAWLGPSERQRLDRFVRRERRRQFVAGRALLRQMLAPLLHLPPGSIALCERAGMAPLLVTPAPASLHFSLSHSGPWVSCALSETTPVGLDIERLDTRRDLAALAQHAFDADQQRWLAAQPPPARLAAFYALWCETEARFKLGQAAAGTHHLHHPGLAIALCSAQILVQAPTLRLDRLERAAPAP
jgi:4'-phosphopantetheinyl transferase